MFVATVIGVRHQVFVDIRTLGDIASNLYLFEVSLKFKNLRIDVDWVRAANTRKRRLARLRKRCACILSHRLAVWLEFIDLIFGNTEGSNRMQPINMAGPRCLRPPTLDTTNAISPRMLETCLCN